MDLNPVAIEQPSQSKVQASDLQNTIRLIMERYPHLSYIPEDMVMNLVGAESSYNPNAVSNKGAVGLMQLLPSTSDYAFQKAGIPAPEDITDPSSNVLGGMLYLDYLKNKLKTWPAAVQSYNLGPQKYREGKRNPAYLKKVIPPSGKRR